MKTCPTCSRNFADDTLIFCTEDGANLTAAYDPNATWQIPAARNTDPPATELIPPQYVPGYQGSGTWPAQQNPAAAPIPPTVQAAGGTPPPFQPPPQYQAAQLTPKKSNTPWIAASAVLAVVALSLIGVLGYMLLRSDSTTGTNGKPDINIKTPNSNNSNNDNSTNPGNDNSSTSNTSVSNTNSGGDGGNDAAWLEGTWSGSGTQYDGGKWTFKYVNANGEHKIDYPSVKCGGKWEPVSIKSKEATFTEKITYGKDCLSNGRVVVTKTSDSEINCKWYYVGEIIGAEANLHKE